jgi:Uma2 family endonuclease
MTFVRATQLSTYADVAIVCGLREYVLVSQDTPRIEVFRRPEQGHWIRQEAQAGGTIAIAGRTIHVDDI